MNRQAKHERNKRHQKTIQKAEQRKRAAIIESPRCEPIEREARAWPKRKRGRPRKKHAENCGEPPGPGDPCPERPHEPPVALTPGVSQSRRVSRPVENRESAVAEDLNPCTARDLPWNETLDVSQWLELQREDNTLERVMKLMDQHGVERPIKRHLQAETAEVRSLCKRWYALVYNPDGILCYRPEPNEINQVLLKRIVPYSMRIRMFLRIHGAECAHMGYDRVHAMISKSFYWYNMSQDIQEWLRACKSCQQAKTGLGAGRPEMKLDLVGEPMMRVGMDLQGPFPQSSTGMVYIMVIQDYFSKWVELFPLPDKRAETVAEVLVKQFFTRFGVCQRLHSDQGLEFDAALTRELCEMWGVQKTRTSPFAPWSNGMVERSNKTIKAILRQLCGFTYKLTWDTQLPFVRMTLNSTVHSTTGFTPFKLFLSRCEDALLPCDLLFGFAPEVKAKCYQAYIETQRENCQKIADLARKHIHKQATVQRANKTRGGLKLRTYERGDYVWRLWKPYLRDKLHSTPWTGPYKVYAVDPDGYTVLLMLPRAGGGLGLKWVHVSNVKPVVLTRHGTVLSACPPGCVNQEALTGWSSPLVAAPDSGLRSARMRW